jgi:aminoglycoside phosphotransferase (APT) family kinase protein
MAFALIDVLAELHAVDPAEVGLDDFGRPDGFLRRQVRRWKTQLDASRGRDVPGLDELHDRLASAVPVTARHTIVHGDYRLDNVIVNEHDHIAAVLDWEMATLGDPLTDLGLFTAYWEGLAELPDNPISGAVTPEAGFPPAEEMIARYAARSGAEVSNLDWYLAFAYFKLAVILEGIHFRFQQGKTVGEGFNQIGGLVAPIVEKASTIVRSGTAMRSTPERCTD